MTGKPLLLEASLMQNDDPRNDRIKELEDELRRMKRDLMDAQVDAARAREDANRALSMLRGQLSPLYRALQAVFGELDAAGVRDEDGSKGPTGTETDRISPVWNAWKQKISPSCGKIIDALLIHKDLNAKQICVAAQIGQNTMYDSISKLNKVGVLDKNGGRFSLKKL